jgi:hypothetical protein
MTVGSGGRGGGTGSADGGTSSGGTASPAGQREGAGTVEAVLDANHARYLDVSPNVRRMPVGIVLVVDQAYLQDVLLAYANSPLRFQITQVHWKRFHGPLGGLGTTGPGGSSGDSFMSSGGGFLGGGFGPGTEGAPMGGVPPRGMSVPPGGVPPRGGVQGPPTGMMPGGLGSGMLTTVSEAQLTAGLIEVCIYGIVSLYEKYDEKKANEQAAQQPGTTPQTTTPPTTDPKLGGKDGKDVTPPKGTTDVSPKGETPKGATPPETPMTPKGDTPKDTNPPKGETPPADPKGKTGG